MACTNRQRADSCSPPGIPPVEVLQEGWITSSSMRMDRTAEPSAIRRQARALERVGLVVLPVFVLSIFLGNWHDQDAIAFDFHHYYWPAGDRVLHGLSPYVHGPWYPSEVPVGFVYPAPTAVLFAAVAPIPREVGDVLFTALAIAAPLLTLRLLDVRDWRPYALVLLWAPTIFGFQTANLSLVFTVAVAAMWRYRDRPRVSGVIFGVIVAMKLFLFPLGLFYLATRRFAALAYAIASTLLFTALSWLIVGLDEIARYRATIEDFTHLREDYGFSVIGFVERVGGGRELAYVIALALAGAAALACLVMARRGRESGAFILALSASLLATPIMWLHYLALLLVPVGLRCPRLHLLWALPILFFFDGRLVDPSTPQVAFTLLLGALIVAVALSRPDRHSEPAPVAR